MCVSHFRCDFCAIIVPKKYGSAHLPILRSAWAWAQWWWNWMCLPKHQFWFLRPPPFGRDKSTRLQGRPQLRSGMPQVLPSKRQVNKKGLLDESLMKDGPLLLQIYERNFLEGGCLFVFYSTLNALDFVPKFVTIVLLGGGAATLPLVQQQRGTCKRTTHWAMFQTRWGAP